MLSECPVCKDKNMEDYLPVRDHTLSQETFNLQQCVACGFVMTNPRPDDSALPAYYESDAYISHAEKSSGVMDTVYKISRHFTMRWKYRVIQEHSIARPSSILDFGCGTGIFLHECEKHQMTAVGIEPSARARSHASKHTRAPVYASLSELTGTFDVITAWHVLEHVTDFHETLRTLKQHLKPQGRMFIAVPNLASYDARTYGAFWAGYDVPRHLWHFSRTIMTRVVSQHGLHLIAKLPMKLDAYYVSLLSEKYKSGKNAISHLSRAIHTAYNSNRSATTTGDYSSIIYILGQ